MCIELKGSPAPTTVKIIGKICEGRSGRPGGGPGSHRVTRRPSQAEWRASRVKLQPTWEQSPCTEPPTNWMPIPEDSYVLLQGQVWVKVLGWPCSLGALQLLVLLVTSCLKSTQYWDEQLMVKCYYNTLTLTRSIYHPEPQNIWSALIDNLSHK